MKDLFEAELPRWMYISGFLVLWSLIGFGAGIFVGNFGWAQKPLGSGEFGDSFGWVTSYFTGLAFVLLAVSVMLQRLELKAVRQERDDANKTNLALQKEAEIKRLEDAFFSLLSILIDRQKDVVSRLDEHVVLQQISESVKYAHNCCFSEGCEDACRYFEKNPNYWENNNLSQFYSTSLAIWKICNSKEIVDAGRQGFLKSIFDGFLSSNMVLCIGSEALISFIKTGCNDRLHLGFMHSLDTEDMLRMLDDEIFMKYGELVSGKKFELIY